MTLVERLRALGIRRNMEGSYTDQNICEAAAEQIEEMEEALNRIVQWADAYPTDIFHEPSAEESRRAHKLLTTEGMTLDAFSASMGRHCLKGVGHIARGTLTLIRPKENKDEQNRP